MKILARALAAVLLSTSISIAMAAPAEKIPGFSQIGIQQTSQQPDIKVIEENGQCAIREEVERGDFVREVRTVTGRCLSYEKAGLIERAEDGFKLSDLALAMGTSRWQAFSAADPVVPQPAPAYYLNVRILGHTQKVAVYPGQAATLANSVNFGYLGVCVTRADVELMKYQALSGRQVDQYPPGAKSRPPRAPQKGESAELKTGAWIYNLKVTGSERDESGSVDIKLTGTSTGPTQFDSQAANQCNGYTPLFETVQIPELHVRVGNKGSVEIPLLGEVSIELVPANR